MLNRRTFLCSTASLAGLAALPRIALADTPADTLVVALIMDDAITFDPAESYETTPFEILLNTYDTLVRYEAEDPSALVGNLAESWEVSADGKTFTFAMRPGVTFASGNPVRAQDVVWSFTRVVKLDKTPAFLLTQLGWTAENIGQMLEAPDDRTFRMTIGVDFAPSLVLNILSGGPASVLDEKLVLENETDGDLGSAWLKDKSAGSGPFVLRTWKPNETIILQANESYWMGPPAMKRVVIRHVSEAASQRLLLERGDVDMARNLPGDQLDQLAANPDLAISSHATGRNLYIGLSQTVEPFQNPKVREAMRYLVDYDGMTKSFLKDSYVTLQSFWPSGFFASVDENPYTFDPDKAKALLAEAGYADGFSFKLNVRNTSPAIDIAQAVQQTLAEAGLKMEIIQSDQKQFITAYRDRQFEAVLGTWEPDFPDPHANASTFASNTDNGPDAKVKTVAWRNSWVNEELTALTEAAVREVDTDKRIEMYKDLQRRVMAEGPYIGLVQARNRVAARANVKGFVMAPMVTYYRLVSK